MGILLVSLFAAFVPSSSAQGLGLFRLTPQLSLDIKNPNATVGIVPADPKPTIIELDVNYMITGILSGSAQSRFNSAGIMAQIQISVGDIPDYCNAFVMQQTVQARIRNAFESATPTPNLRVTFLEHAPLMAEVKVPITLTATVAPAFPYSVENIDRTFYVPVAAAYIPIIDAVPKDTFKEVNPGEIAVFEIELENKGNAETEFRFDLSEVPDGWTASIIAQTKIPSATLGGNSKKIVRFEIRPPYGFGQHLHSKNLEH
jgi:hypothetical protein